MSYRKIDTRLWDDERVAPLSSLAKLTWLCLLTGPHTTGLPGLYSCGIATLSESMREGFDTVSKAVDELCATGMVRFNRTVRVVQIPNAPRYNPCANEKVLKGWFSLWKGIADCPEKFSHIAHLRESVDPESSWVDGGWAKTFGSVSVPDRYRIQTVSISTATAVATTTTTDLSPAAVAPSALPAQATVAPLTLDLGAAKPARAKRAKPPAAPMPFSVADALDALASTAGRRFVVGDRATWAGGWVIALGKLVRQFPDLGDWSLVGAWLAAGFGGGLPTAAFGVRWAASGALPDAVAKARAWDADGRPSALDGRGFPARPTVEAPDPWAAAMRKAGVQ